MDNGGGHCRYFGQTIKTINTINNRRNRPNKKIVIVKNKNGGQQNCVAACRSMVFRNIAVISARVVMILNPPGEARCGQ